MWSNGTVVSTTEPPRSGFRAAEPPRTPKSRRTRTVLFEVSARLFVERGYGAVSMRDIAAEAGLTTGAVYGHFRSKGQLLIETIRWLNAERDASAAIGTRARDWSRLALLHDASGHPIRSLEVDAAAAARHDPEVAAGLEAMHVERHETIRQVLVEAGAEEVDGAAWWIGALAAAIAMRESVGFMLPPEELDTTLRTVLAAVTGVEPEPDGAAPNED